MKQVKLTFINDHIGTYCTILPKMRYDGFLITEAQANRIKAITKGEYTSTLINGEKVNLYMDDNGSGDFYAYEITD